MSDSTIAISGTTIAQARFAKYAPPNSAIASTGEKLGGCGSRRLSAASTIIATSISGPGASSALVLDSEQEEEEEGI